MAQHSCLCGAATHQKPRKCRRMENVPKLCVLFVKGWARAGFRGCCARMRLGPAYSTRPNLRQSPAARRPSATLSPPSLLVSVLLASASVSASASQLTGSLQLLLYCNALYASTVPFWEHCHSYISISVERNVFYQQVFLVLINTPFNFFATHFHFL